MGFWSINQSLHALLKTFPIMFKYQYSSILIINYCYLYTLFQLKHCIKREAIKLQQVTRGVSMWNLEFHHGVQTHLVSFGACDGVHTNQLGFVAYAVSTETRSVVGGGHRCETRGRGTMLGLCQIWERDTLCVCVTQTIPICLSASQFNKRVCVFALADCLNSLAIRPHVRRKPRFEEFTDTQRGQDTFN